MSETEKMAPVQGWPAGIPWWLHLEAYAVYSKKWSPQEALIKDGCRGGFSTGELDQFVPGWRDRISEVTKLRKQVAALEAELGTLREQARQADRGRPRGRPAGLR